MTGEPVGRRAMHAIVRGRVQGVCFRAYTAEKARELGLCGFVRNLGDGSVEAVAEGADTAITAFCAWLRDEGSPTSRVDRVEVTEREPVSGYSGFTIRR